MVNWLVIIHFLVFLQHPILFSGDFFQMPLVMLEQLDLFGKLHGFPQQELIFLPRLLYFFANGKMRTQAASRRKGKKEQGKDECRQQNPR